MRQFNLYDTFGVLTPGVLCVVVAWLLFSSSRDRDLAMLSNSTTLVIGVGTFVCYVLGQLLQGISDIVVGLYWCKKGGIPISWNWDSIPRKKSRSFILSAQKCLVEKRLRVFLQDSYFSPMTLSQKEWRSLIRQIQSLVYASGVPTHRVDAFGGCYGLCKGLIGTFGLLLFAQVIAMFVLPFSWCAVFKSVVLLLLLFFSFLRMHQFGIHFDRELLVCFLALPESFFSQYAKQRAIQSE